jgi:predicted SAM-dependent methyltransferase
MNPSVLENKLCSSPLLDGRDIRLNLGGRTTHIDGFLKVDLFDGEGVDIQTDVSDLSMLKDGTVIEIYASHILEHFSHTKTIDVLKEWRRVLKKGGKASISVPDFDASVFLYQKYGLTDFLRNLLYGDQEYPLAYHYTVFTFATLARSCINAGFADVKRLKDMPYGVKDCSKNIDNHHFRPVSVHVEAIA